MGQAVHPENVPLPGTRRVCPASPSLGRPDMMPGRITLPGWSGVMDVMGYYGRIAWLAAAETRAPTP